MGKIEQCVQDVVVIANESQDFNRAKNRIERLFVDAKAQHRGHFAAAQRVLDQLAQAYDDARRGDARQCLGDLMEWLEREHLGRRAPTH